MKQEQLIGVTHCPHCSTPYQNEAMHVIKKEGRKAIFHFSCKECGKNMLFCVERQAESVLARGIFTDCEQEESKQFWEAPVISIDDVLAAHHALQFDNFLKMR